jgi:hypothetical protein
MDTVTYPNAEVAEYVDQHFVPVQFNVKNEPSRFGEFNACWTPTLLFFDENLREHRRAEGYFHPPRVLGEMALARLKSALDRQRWNEALDLSQEVIARVRGDAGREPEALYWAAVAQYRVDHDGKRLMSGFRRLLERFPESDWAKRGDLG